MREWRGLDMCELERESERERPQLSKRETERERPGRQTEKDREQERDTEKKYTRGSD